MKFFKPKSSEFFNLFKEVGNDLSNISTLLVRFSKEFKDFERYAQEAKKIEHLADQKTYQIVDLLNKTFITPFDREDIYLLAHELDDIIDLTENVVHYIYLYEITNKISSFEEFSDLIKQGAVNTEKLIVCLEKQKCTPELYQIKKFMHDLEDRGDEAFAKAISQLFKKEKDPIIIMKEKEILECLENILDKYQKVSDIIEGILVKSS
ncbi:MAG: DUF47 family protein [Candidatus Paceibacterota bacterium]